MRRKMKGLLIACLCLLGAAMGLPANSLAAENIDLNREVSLTIEYKKDGNGIAGIPFSLYKVADVDAYGAYTLSGDFAEYPVSLMNLSSEDWAALAETLSGYAQRDSLKALDSGETDSTGSLIFPKKTTSLKPGLYLVTGEKVTVDGYTYTTEPFLICLPDSTGEGSESGTWSYAVTAAPKYTREKAPENTVERKVLKVWKDEGHEAKRPKEVVVQLLQNGKVYDTVTLNADNNWRHTWKDLSSSAQWTVVEKEIKGYTVQVKQEGATFVVTNTYKGSGGGSKTPTTPTYGPRLPQTGMLWWPVPMLISGGLLCLVIGTWLRKRSR